jgi:two-component system sensor histidine kinase DctS
VKVSLCGEDEAVQVVVTDEGSGIAPDVLARVFEFGLTTKGALGNGMGLWAVRQILNRHGGEVKIASTWGEGTRLEIGWPRRPAVG